MSSGRAFPRLNVMSGCFRRLIDTALLNFHLKMVLILAPEIMQCNAMNWAINCAYFGTALGNNVWFLGGEAMLDSYWCLREEASLIFKQNVCITTIGTNPTDILRFIIGAAVLKPYITQLCAVMHYSFRNIASTSPHVWEIRTLNRHICAIHSRANQNFKREHRYGKEFTINFS